MWTQNSLYASLPFNLMCKGGIFDNEVDIIEQIAAYVDRELKTIPELSDVHLSVLNDEYLSAEDYNVVNQQQCTAPDLEYKLLYDEIEDLLTNFDYINEGGQRFDVNIEDSIQPECNNQPTTADAIDPIAYTDNASNIIIINEVAQSQQLSEHTGQDVKYFYLTVNVNESYLCDMSKTTINVYDPQSPTQVNSQQLQSLLKPVNITIDTESAARLSLELAEASAKLKASHFGAKTSDNATTVTTVDTFLQHVMQPRVLPSQVAGGNRVNMQRRLLMSHREECARILKKNHSLVTKIRSFYNHSFSETSNGIIGNWSHSLDQRKYMTSKTTREKNMYSYCARFSPVATATHTLDDFRRRDLPCYPKRAAQNESQTAKHLQYKT